MFTAFDALHWSWLVSLTLGIIVITILYVRSTLQLRSLIQRTLAYVIFVGELLKLSVVFIQGKSLLYYLPIHLCGLAIILVMLHAHRPTSLVKEILFSLTLPGAFIALLFPGWTDEPLMSFLHVHSFIYHGIITAYPIMLLASGELKPQAKQLWKVVIFLIFVIPLIYSFNAATGTNYMFLNRPIPNSPLMLIYDTFGAGGYVWGLMSVTFVIWLVQYSLAAAIKYRLKQRTVHSYK